ncbi:RNA polymerase sigma factor [Rhodococcus tukisamuensis]|uniref:RNA polymerase sigma-70 factor, ECF subfamily n=1 Tax=Rhodococcus tukisamuensis TaxID=168276 RepID=A0A1G6TB01_9NOCA|nr:sigma-70 family RNA polymerase sigma factor [Rhodococcus tukisamuensis]SDD25726.1 RNA polymerase sigma-70 factor, ECF subfamily [Rhodococcus tukisamuensis]
MREKPHRSPPSGDKERFTALWDTYAGRVFAYTCRHVDHHTAQEVVSETFLVAWRRLAEVPDPALPWLLVVARNTMSNNRRTVRRHDALAAEMARIEQMTASAPATDVTVTNRAEVLEVLATLTLVEREALLLTAWDGLNATEAARVAGCSVPAMHVRLFRARRRLHTGLPAEPVTPIALRVTAEPRSVR